jgi:hypothetical protein
MKKCAGRRIFEEIIESDDEEIVSDRKKRMRQTRITEDETRGVVEDGGFFEGLDEDNCVGSSEAEDEPEPPAATGEEEDDEDILKMNRIIGNFVSDSGIADLDLVLAKKTTVNLRKVIEDKLLSKKSGTYQKLVALHDSVGEDNEDLQTLNVRSHLDGWTEQLTLMKALVTQSKTWTPAGCKSEFLKVRAVYTKVLELSSTAKKLILGIRNLKKDKIAVSASNNRRKIMHARTVLKGTSLVKQGLPRSLMPFVCEDCFHITVGSNDATVPKATCDQTFVGPSSFCIVERSDEEPDDVAGYADAAVTALKAEIDSATKDCETWHTKHASEHISMMALKSSAGYLKLAEELTVGVAGEMKSPLGLDSFAKPMLMASTEFGYRSGAVHFPRPGVGGFVHNIEGEVLLICLNLQAVLGNGGQVQEIFSLIDGMTPEDAQTFLQLNATLIPLKEPWVA